VIEAVNRPTAIVADVVVAVSTEGRTDKSLTSSQKEVRTLAQRRSSNASNVVATLKGELPHQPVWLHHVQNEYIHGLLIEILFDSS